MGDCYLIVNPDRREYLDPVLLLRSNRFAGVIAGPAAQAVLLLCARGVRLEPHPLAGRWSGDRVLLAGDGEQADLHDLTTATAERPERNLFLAAEQEFRDLSLEGVALLVEVDVDLRRVWGEAAVQDDDTLLLLGAAALATGSGVLDSVLRQRIGAGWASRVRALLGRDTTLTRRLHRAGA